MKATRSFNVAAGHLRLIAFCALLAGCGVAGEDLSFTDPEWRARVTTDVSFPLAEPVTLRVGVSSMDAVPDANDPRVRWIEERTNINLAFVALMTSPGDVELGQMTRRGELPDVMPEDRMPPTDGDVRRLMVNVFEFPSLIPTMLALMEEEESFRNGVLARTGADGGLYSMPVYRPDDVPYLGTIAYRQDLFERYELSVRSWTDVLESLSFLKEQYPQSRPFAGRSENMLYMVPSWFGTGLDQRSLVYFHPDRKEWVFGPFEPEFERYVRFMVELRERGLLMEESFVLNEDMTTRHFSGGVAFMAPYRGLTGPYFRYVGDYGELDEEGRWNGEGAWVSSMPLPENPGGRKGWYDSQFFDQVRSGWMVYNQSEHVGEALALLDLLFGEEGARVMELGPEGLSWSRADDEVLLAEPFRGAYEAGGIGSVRATLADAGLEGPMPLRGRYWGYYGNLGYPAHSLFRYLLANDFGLSVPGETVMLQPGVRMPRDEEFRSEIAGVLASLQTHVESGLARIFVGQLPIDEYGDFIERARAMGAQRLVEAYNREGALVDPRSVPGF